MPTPQNTNRTAGNQSTAPGLLLADALVAVLLVLVPFHAFLTVWTSTFVGHFLLLRLWDEAVLVVLCGVVGAWVVSDKTLRQWMCRSTLIRLIAAYALLMVVLGGIALVCHAVVPTALAYGLTINLRFLVWFLCVWIAARRSAWLGQHWRQLVLVPLALVAGFGVTQFLFLPHDFLAHFGYSTHTYVPFITINQDSSTIRVQSFLRGANPLGAYLSAMVGVLVGMLAWAKKEARLWLLLVLSVAVLGFSFSRSGWIGAGVAGLVGIGLRIRTRRELLWAAGVVFCLIMLLGGTLLALRHDRAVQDAILHVSSDSTAAETSNQGHVASLQESVHDITHEPLGEGPGTSGQESWYNTGHPIRNTESYLLQVAEEAGWLGLGLFLLILGAVGYSLWQRRSRPLAVGLFASLCGLLLVSLFAYAWTDDSLAFVWWGLAGIALAMPEKRVDSADPLA